MLDTTIEIHGDNKQLRVAKLGNGHPVIMLHGYPENLQVFAELAPALAHTHQVIAFDWPGMGYSQEWNGGATPLIMAKRLLSLMDEWRIEKAHLIAQDMGGQPALVFAAMYPDRVSSIVIMNSLVAGDMDTSWEIEWLRKFGINRLLLQRGASLVFWRALHTFLPSNYKLPQPIRNDIWQAFRTPAVRKFIVRMCAGYEAQLKKLPEYYSQITCPTLILWGAKDKHFPPIQAHKLKEYIPHAQLQILPTAPHWMVLSQHEEVAKKIADFYATKQL